MVPDCIVCGGPLPAGAQANRLVCSRQCQVWRTRHGDAPPPVRAGRTCARCGVGIDHRDIRSQFCSARCRERSYAKVGTGQARSCEWCSAEFVMTKRSQRHCSRLCTARHEQDRNRAAYLDRNAVRRARERAAGVVDASFTREQVFDRDGWICQLCLAPIDWDATSRGMRPAIDHIVPLSKGGLHTWDNVQAAHGSCNARKRDDETIVLTSVPGSPGAVIRCGG